MIRTITCILFLLAHLVGGLRAEYPAENRLLVRDGETIAFLGDSITAAGGGHGGYCRLVIHGLKTKGIRARAIYAGVPGDKSSDMLMRLDGILRQKPDHLFLSVGVNDVWHTDPTAKIGVFQPAPGMGVELEHFKLYVPRILDRCQAADTRVILSTFTQITEDPDFRLNRKAQAYNAYLCSLAEERRLPIAFLNEAAFAKIRELRGQEDEGKMTNLISGDGIHPNAVGHQVMALGILKALGFSEEELAALDKEWNSCSNVLFVGGRQIPSGSREGGWIDRLMDVLNDGREMVAMHTVASLHANLARLAADFESSEMDGRVRTLVLVPPLKDVQEKTSLEGYRQSLEAILSRAKGSVAKCIVSTIPLFEPDPQGDLNRAMGPYNEVIRDVCRRKGVALLDVAALMQADLEADPGTRLTLGDERFNPAGNRLMTRTLLEAMGVEQAITPDLEAVWKSRPDYTHRYEHSVPVEIGLTPDGRRALEAVTARYHQIDSGRILKWGVDHLLHDDPAVNAQRLAFTQAHWRAQPGDGPAIRLRGIPASPDQLEAIEAHVRATGIDPVECYRRAFEIALHMLHKDAPL